MLAQLVRESLGAGVPTTRGGVRGHFGRIIGLARQATPKVVVTQRTLYVDRTPIAALSQFQDRCHFQVTAVECTGITIRSVDRERSPPRRQKLAVQVPNGV